MYWEIYIELYIDMIISKNKDYCFKLVIYLNLRN